MAASHTTVQESLIGKPLALRFPPRGRMTRDEFFEFCQVNDELQIERTAEGEILLMAPMGVEGSRNEIKVIAQLEAWANRDRRGLAFGPNAGFELPNGATRSPDAAWVRLSRLMRFTRKEKQRFLRLCPDFVVEIRSATDRLGILQEKMEEYRENGARLGWLIDPVERKVYVYRPGKKVERLDHPAKVSADPELPRFVLRLSKIWNPEF